MSRIRPHEASALNAPHGLYAVNNAHEADKLNYGSGQAAPQQKKEYKISYEPTLQVKKELNSAVSFDANAPNGHTYIPVGLRDLTEKCKELSRQKGVLVYIVSEPLKAHFRIDPHKVSYHSHRIGHHFRNDIVDICWSKSNHQSPILGGSSAWSTKFTNTMREHDKATESEEMNMEQRNLQIRETIRELFPRIPEESLEAVLKQSFEAGAKRVGNAEDIPFPKRVQLAVIANIRHCHTPYEALLDSRTMGRTEARTECEQLIINQILKWRGENAADDEVVELEKTIREVIVLDDEEDDSDVQPQGAAIVDQNCLRATPQAKDNMEHQNDYTRGNEHTQRNAVKRLLQLEEEDYFENVERHGNSGAKRVRINGGNQHAAPYYEQGTNYIDPVSPADLYGRRTTYVEGTSRIDRNRHERSHVEAIPPVDRERHEQSYVEAHSRADHSLHERSYVEAISQADRDKHGVSYLEPSPRIHPYGYGTSYYNPITLEDTGGRSTGAFHTVHNQPSALKSQHETTGRSSLDCSVRRQMNSRDSLTMMQAAVLPVRRLPQSHECSSEDDYYNANNIKHNVGPDRVRTEHNQILNSRNGRIHVDGQHLQYRVPKCQERGHIEDF